MDVVTLQILGWIGSFAYAIAGVPQAYTCIKQGHAIGINPLLPALWVVGAICSLIYISPTITQQLPLVANFGVGGMCSLIMLFYYFYPRAVRNEKRKKEK